MVTTKKTTKKVASRSTSKAALVKKPAAKKAPAKKTTAKKVQMRSFRLSREERAFTDFQVTRQTLYWIILAGFIIFAQLWILKLQIEVASIIDAQQEQIQNY